MMPKALCVCVFLFHVPTVLSVYTSEYFASANEWLFLSIRTTPSVGSTICPFAAKHELPTTSQTIHPCVKQSAYSTIRTSNFSPHSHTKTHYSLMQTKNKHENTHIQHNSNQTCANHNNNSTNMLSALTDTRPTYSKSLFTCVKRTIIFIKSTRTHHRSSREKTHTHT